MEHRNDADLPEPLSPYSHLVLHGDYAFLSGLVATDLPEAERPRDGSFEAEARAVLAGLAALAARHGLSLARAVRVDVHLTDLELAKTFDAVYAEIVPSPRPARTCVEVSRLFGDCRVEVTAMIARD